MQAKGKIEVFIVVALLMMGTFTIVLGSSSQSVDVLNEESEEKDEEDEDTYEKLEEESERELSSSGKEMTKPKDTPFYGEKLSKNRVSNDIKQYKASGEREIKEDQMVNTTNYESHQPIRIDNNTEFAQMADAENWTGNGSEGNPYVIEGYDINGTGQGHAVYIGNVTDHFAVKNCYLHNASGKNLKYFKNSGLHFFNTSNGKAENNSLLNNQNGIILSSSQNDTIANNTIISDLEDGSSQTRLESELVEGFTEEKEEKEYASNSVLVKLKSDSHLKEEDKERLLREKAEKAAENMGGKATKVFSNLEAAEIEISEDRDVMRTVNMLQNRPEIVYAEPNYHLDLHKTPNDPGFDSLWGMKNVNAPEAWNVSTGSGDVVIGVIDTGVDYNHPDLKDNIWTRTTEDGKEYHGYNALNDSYYPMDDVGHGTHVAGTIGAVGNNSVGVTGMNWNVSVMPLKFLGEDGGTTSDAIECLEFVLEKKKEGVNVVATSNSWGGGGKSTLLKEAIARHRDENILFVAAAGNNWENNDRSPSYPASYDLTNVVSVAATNQENDLAYFSNYGNRSVHVAAPGVEINSTLPDGEYGKYAGTSMATPHVSGLAGLLAAHNSSYDYNNLKNVLLSAVDERKGLENLTMTEGKINASKALRTSPSENQINFRVHRPLISLQAKRESEIMISLDDGVNPILGANVSATVSNNQETIYLNDNGTGKDQLADDGYYTTSWTPQVSGEIVLIVRAEVNGKNITEEIRVDIWGDAGISISNSENIVAVKNNVTRYEIGASLISSSDIEVLDNNFSYNQLGIEVYNKGGSEIYNNIVLGNQEGVFLEETHNNSVYENYFKKNFIGIDLIRSSNNTLTGNDFTKQLIGVQLLESGENSVIDNQFTDSFYGMAILRGDRNHLENNLLNMSSDNTGRMGMLIMESNGTVIKNNSIRSFLYGAYIDGSVKSKIDHNSISDIEIDISLYNSGKISVMNNSLDRGILLYGEQIKHWVSHNIDTSNKVNGKPVQYLKNESGGNFDGEAGQLILANCTGLEVTNHKINGTYAAVTAGFSSQNDISRNNLSGNRFGVALMKSKNNTFKDNKIFYCNGSAFSIINSDENRFTNHTISKNGFGLGIQTSRGNVVEENYISHNQEAGIVVLNVEKGNTIKDNVLLNDTIGIILLSSFENVIANNTIRENVQFEIFLEESDDNLLYFNSFINNYGNYNVEPSGVRDNGDNQWYKDGEGNYWSNYEDKYPNASKIQSEGIWNKSYNIAGGDNVDKYPLIEPTTPLASITSPAKEDKINVRNVSVEWTGEYKFDHDPEYEVRVDGKSWEYVGNKTSHNFTDLSDGKHTIEVRITEQEETSNDEVEFMIDTALPEIDIIYPMKEEFAVDHFTAEWEGTPNGTMIEYYELRLGENDWIELGSETNYEFTDVEDGDYTLKVRAVDEAGNIGEKEMPVLVDTTSPELEIISPGEEGLVNDEEVEIEWESSDEVSGIHYFEVQIDDREPNYVSSERSHVIDGLDDGEHTVKVTAFDQLENSVNVTSDFILDTEKPELEITTPKDGKEFNEENVNVEWNSTDRTTGIDHYEVRIDGKDWQRVENTSFSFEGLEDGSHTVEVRAWDEAGNNQTDSLSFTVETTNWWFIGFGIGGIIGILAVGLYVMKRRRNRSFEELEEDRAEISEGKAKQEKEWKRNEDQEDFVDSFYDEEWD